MLLGEATDFGGCGVAHNDQHGVVRCVEGLEEPADILKGRRFQFLQVAVEVVRVVPVAVGTLPNLDPLESAMRLVEHVHAHFFADHVLLVLEVLGADVERSHAIGLQPHRALERVDGQGLEVIGVVEARGAIDDATGFLHEADVLHLLHLRRALEHQVLEQVGKAGAALGLDPEADVVHHLNQRHRGGVVFADDHLQPVGKGEIVDWYLEVLGRRRKGSGQEEGGEKLGYSFRHAGHLGHPRIDECRARSVALRLPCLARLRRRNRRRTVAAATACRCRGSRPGTASGTAPCRRCRWRARRTACR